MNINLHNNLSWKLYIKSFINFLLVCQRISFQAYLQEAKRESSAINDN